MRIVKTYTSDPTYLHVQYARFMSGYWMLDVDSQPPFGQLLQQPQNLVLRTVIEMTGNITRRLSVWTRKQGSQIAEGLSAKAWGATEGVLFRRAKVSIKKYLDIRNTAPPGRYA